MADGGSPDRILAIAIGVVSLASIIALGSLAFSGLALYQSFAGAVGDISSFTGGQSSLGAFNITNGGLLTTTLGISANLTVDGDSIPVLARQLQLQPGETGRFNLSIPLSIEDALSYPGLLQAALFKGVDVNLTIGFSLAMDPFLTASAKSSQTSRVPPVVTNLNVKTGPLDPYNATFVQVPLIYTFFDQSSLSLNGTVNVLVTDSPTNGTLIGAGSGGFSAVASSLNQGNVTLLANQALFKPGVYYANLTVTSSGATGSAVVPFTVGQGG